MRAPAILTIDLQALRTNYRILCNKAGGAAVAGIVKADAYGLGMENIFRTLRGEGCALFFVATPEEALALRGLDNDVDIAVLGGLLPGMEDVCIRNRIVPILNSLQEVFLWQKAAQNHGETLPAILHFDTGMNRLGLGAAETQNILENRQQILERIDLRGIISHFACADEAGNPMTEKQYARFSEIAHHFPNVPKSLANSSGLFRSDSYCFDIVRPGYALYGGNPVPEQSNPMRPVVTLHTKILQVRDVKKGESAGYGAAHVFEKDTRTATAALGYADGFLRSGSGQATLYWNGRPCPVRGRISMDLVTVELPMDSRPQPGDMLEILGPHQDIDTLAAACGTIGYEILTALGKRFLWEYI